MKFITIHSTKIKYFFLIISIFFINSNLFKKDLYFQDIKNNQAIENTNFVYKFQSLEEIKSPKITIQTETIYLSNQKKDNLFPILSDFYFSETSKGLVCKQCIITIYSNDKVYLITSRNSGGSAGYYIHEVFEIIDNHVEEMGNYISCNNKVYLENNKIFFKFREYKCPQLIPDFIYNNWKYGTFDSEESLNI